MVTLTRISLGKCKFFATTSFEHQIIDSVMSFFVEGAIFSDKYKKGFWDGYYRFYDKNNEFDFGLISEIMYAFEANGIRYKYSDNYKPKLIIDNLVFEKEGERLYQSEAVTSFFDTDIGIVIVPTRGGKTYISNQCIQQINKRFPEVNSLLIVDSVDLFEQTVSEYAAFLGVDESEIGKINDSNLQFERVTIAMVQTLQSIFYGKTKNYKKQRLVNKHLLSIGMLVVDEIQDNSSDARLRLYRKCKNVNWILGLSATPFKQMDEKSAMKVKGFFGGICYEVSKKRLQKEGYLSWDKAFLISNQVVIQGKPKPKTYAEFLAQGIYDNEFRNEILIKVMEICKRNQFKTLFLFNSKYHGRKIAEITGETFIDGDSKKTTRRKEKENFLLGKGKILLASNIFKKGITLPEVEVVMLADGGLEGTVVIQKFGRVLGATLFKKHSAVIDILDIGNRYFSEHSLNRLEVYEHEIGKKRIEIYNDTDWLDFEESLKEWLHVNK